MTQVLFADRVRRIDLVGPCVRIEFSVSRAGEQEGEIAQEPGPTVVMPIDGFAQGASLIQRIVDQLVEKEILKPVDQAEAEADKGGSKSGKGKSGKAASSPNFD